MGFHIDVPDYVENESAYVAAAEARIRANAAKGRQKRFLAVPVNAATIERLDEYLHPTWAHCGDTIQEGQDEYVARCHSYECPREGCGRALRKQNSKAPRFLWDMFANYLDWGQLSEKQIAAVNAAIDRAEQRKVEIAAEKAAKAATARHIGTVGERLTLRLKVVRTFGYEGTFGYVHSYVCEDADGNVVIYKGNVLGTRSADCSFTALERGDEFSVKATIKAHNEREGIAQTLISRPKIEDGK